MRSETMNEVQYEHKRRTEKMQTTFTEQDIALVKRMLAASTMQVFAKTEPSLYSAVTDNDTLVIDGFVITLEPMYHRDEAYVRYILNVEVHTPATRTEPEEVYYKVLDTATSLKEAVQIMLMHLCWNMIDSALEADALAAAYAAD